MAAILLSYVCVISSQIRLSVTLGWVRGHSRSFKLVPLKSSSAVFYSPSIVTTCMALSCIVCEIQLYLLVENRKIFIPHLYLAPSEGWFRRNFAKMFDIHKTRMIGLLCGEKKYHNMLSRFHRMPERDGRTYRIAISISRVMCWRAIKCRPCLVTAAHYLLSSWDEMIYSIS